MRSYMYKVNINFILLCFVFCMLFTGCNGSTSQDNKIEGKKASGVTLSNESEFILPQELTMEFFGADPLKMNRGMWEEHIFSLYDSDAYEYSVQFPVGDYEITNSYLNFQNQNNLSTYITYGENSRGSSILYDENDDLKMISIESDMGEAFCTSYLNIGDNVKDYLESIQPGLWDKFLNDELNGIEQGWYMWHTVADVLESDYDVFQISNDDIVVSYFIADESVDKIMLDVVGDIHVEGTSLYGLDDFTFYINGTDITTMSIDYWTNFMYSPEAHVDERKIVNEELIENPVTGNLDLKTDVLEEWKEFYCPMEGTEIFIYGIVMEKSSLFYLYNINDVNIVPTDAEVIHEFRNYVEPDMVQFYEYDDFVEQTIHITGGSGGITSNEIMPGDNIKTFLNSYEEGLYEKLISLPEDNNIYQIEPYRFIYAPLGDGTKGVIEITRDDERHLPIVSFYFKDEIVTEIMIH